MYVIVCDLTREYFMITKLENYIFITLACLYT